MNKGRVDRLTHVKKKKEVRSFSRPEQMARHSRMIKNGKEEEEEGREHEDGLVTQ